LLTNLREFTNQGESQAKKEKHSARLHFSLPTAVFINQKAAAVECTTEVKLAREAQNKSNTPNMKFNLIFHHPSWFQKTY